MKKYLFLLLISLFLCSCSEIKEQNSENCLPNITQLAFPVYETQDPIATKEAPILPLGEWKQQGSIPAPGYSFNEGPIFSLIAYPGNQLWVLIFQKVLRYDESSNKWTTYSQTDNLPGAPKMLFLSKSNELWGAGFSGDQSANEGYSFLSLYNPKTDRFEFVHDDRGILSAITDGNAAVDNLGRIWIMAYYYRDPTFGDQTILFSFDPKTLHLEKQAEFPQNSITINFVIGADNSIWFVDKLSGRIQEYIPATHQLVYPYPNRSFEEEDIASQNLHYGANLYFDRQGRLWVDDRGWLEFKGRSQPPLWNAVIRSSVFIWHTDAPDRDYLWLRPDLTYQSSDNKYWFSSVVGLVSLDPSTGVWCRFTNGDSPFAEDAQHNLWIAVFGKLYKYALNQ